MKLPNVRNLFIPDHGYLIADVDLDRADLQVVIAEADDDDLRQKCAMGVDLHIANGLDIRNIPQPPMDELVTTHPEYPEHAKRYAKERKFAKAWVHGTNYGGKPKTMAKAAGCTVRESDEAQKRWFSAHPGIKTWHERTQDSLNKTKTVSNVFGFRRQYFGRMEHLLPEALAWVPQSTVAIVTNKAIVNLYHNLPKVDPLLQVHDSIVFQYPKHFDPQIRPVIREQFLIEIPYEPVLVIGVGLKISNRSWGECKDVDWGVAA